MPGRPLLGFGGALLLGLASLSACGRQVDVAPPESPAAICGSLPLPETVAGAARRPTSGGDGTGAWGEPPITLRCGVARPVALTATSQLLVVDGVGWLPIEGSGGAAFVAVDWPTSTEPTYVEVIVPAAYAPGEVLADITPALTPTPTG